eukprot:364133-Chlamydomonas_euryale.AAC.16
MSLRPCCPTYHAAERCKHCSATKVESMSLTLQDSFACKTSTNTSHDMRKNPCKGPTIPKRAQEWHLPSIQPKCRRFK